MPQPLSRPSDQTLSISSPGSLLWDCPWARAPRQPVTVLSAEVRSPAVRSGSQELGAHPSKHPVALALTGWATQEGGQRCPLPVLPASSRHPPPLASALAQDGLMILGKSAPRCTPAARARREQTGSPGSRGGPVPSLLWGLRFLLSEVLGAKAVLRAASTAPRVGVRLCPWARLPLHCEDAESRRGPRSEQRGWELLS